METSIKSQDATIELTPEIKEILIGDIPKKWDKFNDNRREQLENYDLLENLVFYQPKDTKSFLDDPKLPEVYELYDTLHSHIWEAIYSSPESMFEVMGEDKESSQQAPNQKAALVYMLNKMKIKDELEYNVKDFCFGGDLIGQTKWVVEKEPMRRFKTEEETADEKRKIEYIQEQMIMMRANGVMNNELGQMYGMFGEEMMQNPELVQKAIQFAPGKIKVDRFVVEDKTKYKGPKVKFINTKDFVFDVSRNFEDSLKIHRTWMTIDDIFSMQEFELTDEEKEKLQQLAEDIKGDSQIHNIDREKAKNGENIEVLYCEGDILVKTPDKRHFLKNWHVVIVGRLAVARFEANPFLKCSYTYGNVVQNPRTKRGQSLLLVGATMNLVSNKAMKNYFDLYELIMNPHWIGPEGAFGSKKKIIITPGGYTDIKSKLNEQKPEPYKPNATPSWELMQYSKQTMASATGVFPNMTGNTVEKDRTKFEVQNEISGQTARQGRSIDIINMRYIIPIIESIAFCAANFADEDLKLLKEPDGNKDPEEVIINTETIQGDYKYTYSDKKASTEKKNRFGEFINFIEKFFKFAPDIIDKQELFKYGLEQQSIENINRFISENPLTSILSQIPEEQRPIFEQRLAEILKGMLTPQQPMQQGMMQPQVQPQVANQGVMQ